MTTPPKNQEADYALHEAAKAGDEDALNEALKNGANVSSKDINRYTALHWAAIVNEPNIIDLLLKNKKIKVNAKNTHGNTPLHEAARNGCTDAASLLIEHKALVNMQNGMDETPLHLAARMEYTKNPGSKNLGMAELLVANKADLSITNKYGQTATDVACETSRNARMGEIHKLQMAKYLDSLPRPDALIVDTSVTKLNSC